MVHTLTQGSLVIYDTEWTSWSGFMESNWQQPGHHMEIIQIGAVKLDVEDNFKEIDSFQCFVKPLINPELSDYIIELTGITQTTVDHHGVSFPDALKQFLTFIGEEICALISYGRDKSIVDKNCKIHNIPMPTTFEIERDIRKYLLNLGLIHENSFSSDVPSLLGLPNSERSHDALGDARSLGASFRHLREQGTI
ncbi:MAG: exonuclease domain-containing protein [Magnetovibrio sp.]|nr:exonuclease domain-containing protein [Magnetovibrio sp.]